MRPKDWIAPGALALLAFALVGCVGMGAQDPSYGRGFPADGVPGGWSTDPRAAAQGGYGSQSGFGSQGPWGSGGAQPGNQPGFDQRGAPSGYGQNPTLPGGYPQAPNQAAFGAGAPSAAPGWPNAVSTQTPAFQGLPDAAQQAEQRADVFGRMPDVRMGSARAVSPGSTGVSGRTELGGRSVPFGGDGGAIQAPTRGTVQPLEEPTRSLPEAVQSRSLLIDDYSKALDERDALRRENESLQGEVRELQGRLLAAEKGLGAGQSEVRVFEEQKAQLEYQLQLSEQERRDLEARLVTAQIRRLEAEKSLLEAWIEAEQARANAGLPPNQPATPGAAQEPSAADPATPLPRTQGPLERPSSPTSAAPVAGRGSSTP